jgi:zinc protease
MSSRSLSQVFIATLFVLSFSIASFAQALPAGVKKVATVEGITEYSLDNGLRVLLFPDNTKQTVTVNITYLVGSRHENYGETGMAHLLEHLVFKGTPNHPNIPAELTKYGASPNGTTSFDRTNYYETVAATEENLNWALDLEADRMVNSFIAKKDLDSEFSVVRNELESGDTNPIRVTLQKLFAISYDWHNYGKSTIGARSDLENVPIDRLQAFYRKYYQPDNAVLLVAGKFDVSKTLATINTKFGAIPRPKRKLPPIYTVEPVQDGERSVTVRRVGDIKFVLSGYRIAPDTHPDIAVMNVLENIMVDQPSGRLYKALVEPKKAVQVLGINFPTKDPGVMMFGAIAQKTGDIDDIRTTMIDTVEKFGDAPPTKEEVERSKTQILKNIDLTLNNPNRLGLGMSEYISQGDWRLFFIQRDRVKTVTVADIQRVAKKYFKRSNRSVGSFIPTEKPDRADIPNVTGADVAKIAAEYKGGEKVAAGEAFDPSPANIMARTTESKIGGLEVALLPKENRGDAVFARMTLRFGDQESLMNKSTAAGFTGQLLSLGTATKSRQEIQDEFDRLKARVSVSGSATGANVSIETDRANLAAVMKLVAEILKTPSFPENEFTQLREQRLNGLENGRSNPQGVAVRAMSQHFNKYEKGHVRYSATLDEQIANVKVVTLDQVKAFHKDFYGASTGELAVVGDFDPKAVSGLVEELFANWKSPTGYTRVPSDYFDIPAVNKKFETPDKANAFFLARLNLKLRDDNPDYAAMEVANSILGGGFLNSRLASRIRGKDGLSYSVGSQMQIASRDQQGALLAFAIYNPGNLEKLEAAFNEEIMKVITDGFTEDEVKAAVKGMVLAAKRRRATDSSVAGTLTNYMSLNRPITWDADYEKKLESLTAAEVSAAIKKYLTPEKISIFKAGDFAKAAKAPATK